MSFNPLLFNKLPYDADNDFALIARLFFLIEGVFVTAGARRQFGRRAQGAGAGEAGRAQLRHARARLVSRPVPEMAQQPVGHQHRRHPLSRRRADRRRRWRPTRCRSRASASATSWRCSQAGKIKALAVGAPKRSPAAARRADLHRSRARRLSGPGWWGIAAPKGTPPRDHRQAQRRVREAVQRAEVHRFPRQAAGDPGADRRRQTSPPSCSRTASTPRR